MVHASARMISGHDCIFCKIVAGTSPCQEIYQDSATLSFMDINPANDGHCLVIPKMHFETVFEMSPDAFAAVARAVTQVARAVNDVVKPGRDKRGAGKRRACGANSAPCPCACPSAADW
jgi:diadenosine tetraphosphate (Ap4A) HIT family hydrolase